MKRRWKRRWSGTSRPLGRRGSTVAVCTVTAGPVGRRRGVSCMVTASGTRSAGTLGARPPARASAPERTGPPLPPKPPRDPLWARILVVVGALLMVASGVAIIGEKYMVNRYTSAVAQRTFGGEAAV